MSKVQVNQIAPDFVLKSFTGKMVRLSDYYEKKNVIIVLNRGFA